MRSVRHDNIASDIAATLLAGAWNERAMLRRLGTLLGPATRRPQRQMLAEVLGKAASGYPPSHDSLAALIATASAFEGAVRPLLRSNTPIHRVLRPPRFAPIDKLRDLDVPRLATVGDVADWLGVSIGHLDWLADVRRQHGRTAIPILQHYTYAFRKKTLGPPRLIEAPKPRLRTIQRRILSGILDRVPSHDDAYGFVPGRSCRMGAERHVGAAVVVCLDVREFFLTTPLGRVHALFRSLGYPHEAARVLTGLCSTRTPSAVLDRVPSPARHTRAAMRAYEDLHLPQGAPTSPALANLGAWRLDVRLSGLARAFGARYSRYADDMTFSGGAELASRTDSLVEAVDDIVGDEGYALNSRKTRVMTASVRQQVTGIVVNAHTNVGRDEFDRLKAILHNCRRHGLEAENRQGHTDFRAHLDGRVGWVESLNPIRGAKLRRLLDAIPR
ncbi:MAG: reverse transcriptase family protein [Hyphomicrobiaceae bacterium]